MLIAPPVADAPEEVAPVGMPLAELSGDPVAEAEDAELEAARTSVKVCHQLGEAGTRRRVCYRVDSHAWRERERTWACSDSRGGRVPAGTGGSWRRRAHACRCGVVAVDDERWSVVGLGFVAVGDYLNGVGRASSDRIWYIPSVGAGVVNVTFPVLVSHA